MNESNTLNFTEIDCSVPQAFSNECFVLLGYQNLGLAIFGFTLVACIIIANFYVIFALIRNNRNRSEFSIFDQIIIGTVSNKLIAIL